MNTNIKSFEKKHLLSNNISNIRFRIIRVPVFAFVKVSLPYIIDSGRRCHILEARSGVYRIHTEIN
jgi:hypothetical protein